MWLLHAQAQAITAVAMMASPLAERQCSMPPIAADLHTA